MNVSEPGHAEARLLLDQFLQNGNPTPFYKIVTKYILLWNGASPDPKSETKLVFYSIGGT